MAVVEFYARELFERRGGATQATKCCVFVIVYRFVEYVATDFSKYAKALGSFGAEGRWWGLARLPQGVLSVSSLSCTAVSLKRCL